MSEINLWAIENSLYAEGYKAICGVDEAGRGPLAGPVCAAAVILPPHLEIPGLNDSKKLTDKRRRELMPVIVTLLLPSMRAILYAAAEVYPKPTMAPNDVRSTNQMRVLRPKSDSAMAIAIMKFCASHKVKLSVSFPYRAVGTLHVRRMLHAEGTYRFACETLSSTKQKRLAIARLF